MDFIRLNDIEGHRVRISSVIAYRSIDNHHDYVLRIHTDHQDCFYHYNDKELRNNDINRLDIMFFGKTNKGE